MSPFCFRAAATAGPCNVNSGGDETPGAARSREETGEEQSLSAIDHVVQSLSHLSSLGVAVVEQAARSALGGHHPDSPDVLLWCRRRHPDWPVFPEQTICAVYQRLLFDRRAMSVFWRIANEPPATGDRVLATIARLAPDGCDDDIWWTWWQLVVYDPENREYEYSRAAIRRAWRAVRSRRARSDGTGRGHGRRRAGRCRRQAMARLTADLSLSAAAVEALDVDDYCPSDGTLASRAAAATAMYNLSAATRQTLVRWLDLRGFGAGCLFDFPPMGRRLSLDGSLGRDGGHGLTSRDSDACAATDSEDFVEHLCAGLGEVAHAFVLEVLTDEGDCPARVISIVAAGCPSFSGTDPPTSRLTKQQRCRGRAKLKERAVHLGVADCRTAPPGQAARDVPIAKTAPNGQDKRASGADPSLQ